MINNPRASGSETPSPRYCWEKGGRQKGTTGAVRAASPMFEFFHIIFARACRPTATPLYKGKTALLGFLLRVLGEVPGAGLRALILCFRELAKTQRLQPSVPSATAPRATIKNSSSTSVSRCISQS